MVKFFFYGIFLDKRQRESLGIYKEPHYATVRDYMTIGSNVVLAMKVYDIQAALTGLVVEVPEVVIPKLDRIENGYKRITVRTVQGEEVQMYVG